MTDGGQRGDTKYRSAARHHAACRAKHQRTDVEEFGFTTIGYRRTSPAAGGLQSPEPYVVIRNVDGIRPGLYHYPSNRHCLIYIGDQFDSEDLGLLLGGQMWANELAVGIFIASNIDRLAWKYPNSRSYRVAQIDIGALLQTFQLTCTALGLSTWPTGYFLDRELDRLLGLDQNKQLTMFFFGVGPGEPQPISRKTIGFAAGLDM
ncbi:MAG: SagB/ThcOx family dehydrogenase [Neoaquamicrobium sediminum]|uniref:SagB/ThcOx family dehydrogenase n=1 Tax=Neoaquamicrobium sediminum TaxID=1849104 RepID=UPI0040353F31